MAADASGGWPICIAGKGLAEAIDSLKGEDDELAWAKPLVEEGLAELNRREVIPAEEVFARVEARLREKM